jgi:heme exporter protein D
MSFASFGEFLAMGGHAVYVWTAYGLAVVVLAVNLAAPLWRARRLLRELRAAARRRDGAAAAN